MAKITFNDFRQFQTNALPGVDHSPGKPGFIMLVRIYNGMALAFPHMFPEYIQQVKDSRHPAEWPFKILPNPLAESLQESEPGYKARKNSRKNQNKIEEGPIQGEESLPENVADSEVNLDGEQPAAESATAST